MFQNIDFRLNVTPDATNLTNLKAINAELEKMVDLMARTGMGGGGGGVGMGGAVGTGPTASAAAAAAGVSGGGGGGGGSTRVHAASVSNLSNSVSQNAAMASGMGGGGMGGGSAAGMSSYGLGLMQSSVELSAMSGNPEQHKMSSEERHRANLRRWQLTMGIQSLGYGLEDIYYSGIRGALNNFPFAAQGLAALAGVDPTKSMAVAGVAALVGTTGMVAYDNRERIAKSMGINLGTREESIFGIPDLSGAQKAQKEISDAMYYVDKYGRGSNLGQRYLADAIGAMEDQNRDLLRRGTEQDVARIRGLPDVGMMSGASILASAGIGGDNFARRMAQEKVSVSEGEIRKQAEMLYRDQMISPIGDMFGANLSGTILGFRYANPSSMPDSFLAENRRKATENAEREARRVRDTSATSFGQALAGDPGRINELEKQLNDGSLSGRDRRIAEATVNMARNMSSFDAQRINALKSGAANPYANIDRRMDMINNYLGEAAGEFGPSIREEMEDMRRRSPTRWQQSFTENESRYVANIAASFGGIMASGSRGRFRDRQINALESEIYNDLIRSGVPPTQARTLAKQLKGDGQDAFNKQWNDSNLPNGMTQMQNFMMGLGDEQQMMFGQFNQNAMQMQMHQQMLRQQRMRRTRFGMRGMQ